MLIVKGLIDYRNKFLRSKYPKLEHIRAKLQQIAADDRQKVSVIPAGSTTLPSSTVGRSNARNLPRNLRTSFGEQHFQL